MDNIERRDREMAYISDRAVMEEQKRTRKILHRLNTVDPSDFDEIGRLVKELFGKSDKAFVNPPFYCDYGFHIETGKNFFANYNLTIQSSETIDFSRLHACFSIKPYLFALVFALTNRNKGNFLYQENRRYGITHAAAYIV